MTETPEFHKSSYSNNGGACVEVATNLASGHGIVPVRDSKDLSRPALGLGTDSFTSFVSAIKAGHLSAA
ncbi:DUF397 domain-containing protein [Streptomyces sp. NBC_01218]|uniref:DUF397 domain-containing protein n=1 Tax=Streptomyces sp. NBC_01218 TaxID=2903780 RepID=UPI002E12C384|nr:DUF397 domain-containing protein [Streptomyces sp. NBC_01218]